MKLSQNSLDNLIPYKKGDSTGKVESGRLGGIASGESKRQKKMLKEILADILQENMVVKDKEGNEKTIPSVVAITKGLITKAAKGDSRAYEVIRDTLGEKPAEKVDITTGLESNIDKIKAMEEYFKDKK